MRTIEQGFGAQDTEKDDPRIGHSDASNRRPDASHSDIAAASPSLREPRRWVPHRKAEVVAAVRGGFISLEEARRRYALSMEEYLSWQREIDRFGLAGLRVYRPQPRRPIESRPTDQ